MKKLLLSALLVASSAAFAGPIGYNTEEYRLNGFLDFDSANGTDIQLEVGYGYFFQDYTQAGITVGVADNDFITTLSLGTFLEYNFDTDTEFTPFVGGQLRYLYSDVEFGVVNDEETGALLSGIDESISAVALGLYVGFKYFIADNLAISARLLFEVATDDVYLEEDRINNVDVTVDLGLRYFY